ncbi:MAG: 50S ribosomal protein L24 [Clostridia bacterium]|nr:50S ribosomal protein L24 [Clostridia bacterium]
MKVKKNDTVYVVTGKDAGKTGKVLSADPKNNKVVVEGVNVQKKHYKARRQGEVSAIKPQSGPIDASNVMVFCPKCNHGVRVHYVIEGDKKFRACAKCNTNLDEVKPAPVARKAAKAAATDEKAVKRTKKAKAEKAE